MPKTVSFLSLSGLTLDKTQATPLHRQLYKNLRHLILSGQLPAGLRLPSSRAFSIELGVSRNTIMNAFEQLTAEGYIDSKVGAGTFVCHTLPEKLLQLPNEPPISQSIKRTTTAVLSRRGQQVQPDPRLPHTNQHIFSPGMPDTRHFPFNIWRKLMNHHWRQAETTALGYGSPAGHPTLRSVIADYVRATRGVRCQPEHIIITSGTQQAIHMAVQLLTDLHDTIWMENPGYGGAKAAMRNANATILPIPVDEEGIDVHFGVTHYPHAKMAYVTPSHQYPLGVTMSLSRRLALLQWAAKQNAWILEDDYDSGYRYVGHPLAALQGLDQENRVIYIGTFSKVLFPALRLGYMVVPPSLSQTFTLARDQLDRGSPWLTQATLADFMKQGHFARHIRRMRTLYAARQQILQTAVSRHLPHTLTIRPAAAGIHLIGWLPEGVDDTAVANQLYQANVNTPALSRYSLPPYSKPGLLIGYANNDEGEIWQGIKIIATVLKEHIMAKL